MIFSSSVQPIRIASYADKFYLYEDKIVYVIGAGEGHTTGVLQHGKFRVKNNQKESDKMGAKVIAYGMPPNYPGTRNYDWGKNY